jgi:hypothetical protein
MKNKARGQSLLEFALVLPVIVLLVIGGLQMIRVLILTSNVRAAAHDAVELAAIHGGDTPSFRDQLPAILETHRLDPDLAEVQVNPPQASYLRPVILHIEYPYVIRVYGFIEVPIQPQQARALSQKDWAP